MVVVVPDNLISDLIASIFWQGSLANVFFIATILLLNLILYMFISDFAENVQTLFRAMSVLNLIFSIIFYLIASQGIIAVELTVLLSYISLSALASFISFIISSV